MTVLLPFAAGVVCFALGFVIRGEVELWRRSSRRAPSTIDFTRKRVGS